MYPTSASPDKTIDVHLPEQRHALAALALHGQPFGFTREDVDAIRRAAGAIEGEWGGGRPIDESEEADVQDLVRIAAKMAALLPPT